MKIFRLNGEFEVMKVFKLTEISGDICYLAQIENYKFLAFLDKDEYNNLKSIVPHYEDSLFYQETEICNCGVQHWATDWNDNKCWSCGKPMQRIKYKNNYLMTDAREEMGHLTQFNGKPKQIYKR